jgi:hypothetical protein
MESVTFKQQITPEQLALASPTCKPTLSYDSCKEGGATVSKK